MSTTRLLLLAFAHAVPAIGSAETLRAAVVVVGADSSATGTVQDRLETSLSGRDIQIVRKDELALRLAAKSPAPPRDDSAILALFLQAREAYFDDRLDEAMDRVESASRFVSVGLAAPGADRVAILTWQSALYLVKNDTARAEAHARLLLALSPDVKPDLNVFRPSFGRFIDELRQELPKPVEVSIERAPQGTRLEVDGRIVERRFRIAPGVHKLSARAPGFQFVSVPFDARHDLVIKLALPLDVEASARTAIGNAIWSDGPTAPIRDLGRTLSVDVLIAAGIHPDGRVRALVLRSDAEPEKSDAVQRDGISALIAWINAHLGQREINRLALKIGSDLAFHSKKVAVEFDSGVGFETTLAGPRGAVAGVADYGASRAELSLAATSYGRSRTTFETSEVPRDVNGGAAIEGRALISYGFEVWRVSLRPNAGLRFEDDSSGGSKSFAVFPAYSRVDALVGGTFEFGNPELGFDSGAFVTSNLVWQSSNGWRRARISPGLGWSMRVKWRPEAWTIAASYAGEQRSSEFSGAYPIPSSAPLLNATVHDIQHIFALSVSYALR